MPFSQELQDAMRDANQALAGDPNGELVLPHRKRIWRAFGPILIEAKRAVINTGLKRRTKLAGSCAGKVLRIWKEAFPTDPGPETMLETAHQYLRGDIDWDSAWSLKNRFWGKLDNLMNEGEHFDRVHAGYSAANVVTTALNDERLGPLETEPIQLDDNLDPFEWDASFYASLSYAGGASWEEQSDGKRRREFWQWYLAEAVPSAWEG